MKKILVVGSLNMDLVTKVNCTPKVGETVAGQGLAFIPGGKGANQAVALGKLGAQVEMIGVVGNDGNGKILLNNLKEMAVTSKVRVDDSAPTGTALIMVNASSDNSIVVIPGANDTLRPKDVIEEWFHGIDLVLCQLETPLDTIEKVMKKAKLSGAKTILNPAPAKKLSNDLLKHVDLLVPNETEFESITGVKITCDDDIKNGYAILNKIGINEIIVTLGKDGACYYNGHDFIKVHAQVVDAIDTTAAGDSFIAGVCDSLARGYDIKKALDIGTKVAAITVTRFGAQSSLPYRKELDL